MSQIYVRFPAGASASTNASVGLNGDVAPTSSTEVGGIGPDGKLHPISTDNSGVQNVNVASSALPTGGATAANQVTQEATLTAIQSNQTNGTQTAVVSGSVSVSNFPATQPVSGTVAVSNFPATQPISATSLPLPTGASTLAAQTTGNTSLASIDTKTPALGAAATAASTPVNIASDQTVPTIANDTAASGNITTQNLNPTTGTPTAGSFVQIALNGQNSVGVQISGTYTGALQAQVSIDGVNWAIMGIVMTVAGVVQGSSFGSGINAVIAAQVTGSKMFRIAANTGAVTGTAVITLNASVATTTYPNITLTASANNIGNVNLVPVSVSPDVVSAAITTTTTSTNLTPAAGGTYNVNVVVTAVSGTNPTMSVAVQESVDGGVNWITMYTFPTITATGSYYSPYVVQRGRIIRYVQTITGTTPSFTRSINRSQSNQASTSNYINFIDTAIAPITTNSTTASVFVENTNTYTAIVNQGAGGSSVVFALDGSDDNVSWVLGLKTVAGIVGGATPVSMVYSGVSFRYIRVRVVTGVASTTISYVSIAGYMGNGDNTIKATPGVLIDRSGITSGTPNTSTQLMAANPSRKYLLIQNVSQINIWINFTTAANGGQPSFQLLPGGSIVQEASFVSTEAVNVLSGGTSTAYTAKEA